MNIEQRDGSTERAVLIGMICHSAVLGKISAKWVKGGLLKNNWTNLIGSWCVAYYGQYGKAPGKDIEGLFRSWAADSTDKDTIQLVEKFLSGLSKQYSKQRKDINPEYLVDLAAKHFQRVQLYRLQVGIKDDLDAGRIEKAQARVDETKPIELGEGAGIDLLYDKEAIKNAFEVSQESIIHYPGALGRFLGDSLSRDSFVCLMGPEKRGKTWWLMDFAWMALKQRRKVAFFEIGDLSEGQIIRRFMTRASKRPAKATRKDKPIRYPKSIKRSPEEQMAEVVHEEKFFEGDLSWQTAWKACKEIMQSEVKSKESLFKLSVHPNSTISAKGIHATLQTWERSGWVPDVLVIDYADLLSAMSPGMDQREQINSNWKHLRALSQIYHCCLITATQSDAASYNARTIGRSNFTDDKRKLAHCTAMIGLNQTIEEKQLGLTRLNFTVLREDEYSESACVHVAGCLGLARPAIRSTF